MKAKNIIREVSYKGHIITVFEDGFHQEFVIIDNDESKLYDSIADAKRVIRGEQPYYVTSRAKALRNIEDYETVLFRA